MLTTLRGCSLYYIRLLLYACSPDWRPALGFVGRRLLLYVCSPDSDLLSGLIGRCLSQYMRVHLTGDQLLGLVGRCLLVTVCMFT